MLHEHTAELEHYFARSGGVFNSPDDLAEKARWFLHHADERLEVATAGHRRCSQAATPASGREILTVHEERLKTPVRERCWTTAKTELAQSLDAGCSCWLLDVPRSHGKGTGFDWRGRSSTQP